MRGTILDLIFISIIFLIFGIISVFSLLLLNEFTTAASGQITGEAMTILTNTQSFFPNFDYIFIFLVFGTIIALIVGSFMIETHPAFFIVSLFILIIELIIMPQMANVFLEFASNEQLITTANQFPFMVYLFQHWPIVILIAGVVIIIAIYGKSRGGNYAGY